MNIGGIGQVGHVNEAARAEVATASARAQPVVIGFGPMTEAARDNGLAMPRAGVSAARPPMMRVAGGEGHLLAEARAHFVRERPEVVSA
ncbi:MAG TPA: hypothetical protein VLC93_19905, partial [Myxococcota bacterium]|nr:hypothetical protein [Myxococcota bacterium]